MTGAAAADRDGRGQGRRGTGRGGRPRGLHVAIQAGLTEPTFLPLPETADGTVAAEAAVPVLERLEAADALAIGPGLTTDAETVAFVRDVVRRSPVPVVLDADGLNAFTGDGGGARRTASPRPCSRRTSASSAG